MPLSPSQLRTQLGSLSVRTNGSPTTALGAGQVVTIDIVFQGVAVNPLDLLDMLEAKYGAGKVSSDRDSTLRHGPYSFRVIA